MTYKARTTIIFIALCSVGFLFRLWIAGAVPQPFVYDQEEYYGYALGIINKGLHADLYRLYGYPLIIAPLIYFFGVTSPLPWTVFHAVVDTMTAGLVYWIAKKIFNYNVPSRQTRLARLNVPAWIAFILYLFNPFTAGYVGVLLSEVVTVFLVTLISTLMIRYFEKKSTGLFFVLILLLGFLPQVRPVFIALSVAGVGALVWEAGRRIQTIQERLSLGFITIVLFSLPFWYTIAGNLVYYKQFSVLGVEPTFIRELYASLFIGRGMPFTDTKWGDWPPEAQNAWGAFTSPPDAAGRAKVADTHLQLAIAIIRRDPLGFVQSRLAKMGYVWEKHFIYPYVMGDPSPEGKTLTYWGNLAVLLLGLVGMATAYKQNKGIVLGVSILVLYISLAHIFSTSEERFSLPSYPWIAVFAGYGIWWLVQRLRAREVFS
ncbi:hypothetical protein HY949_03920 [Candidatus Gottesmanbacteria bacterium]|nr:hypothetical protein [Candidatus Gottesmanbacteria bacterium]